MAHRRPGVPWFTLDDLAWIDSRAAATRFRRFVQTNVRGGREVIVTAEFVAKLHARGIDAAADDPDTLEMQQPRATLFASAIVGLGAHTRYVLSILRPYADSPIDGNELEGAWSTLTGGSIPLPQSNNYTIVVGEVGSRPLLVASRERPFRVRTTVGTAHIDIRMESWLPTDTIRRAGFGHVIVNRRHVLTLDRGVSFVALDPRDEPTSIIYRGGRLAPLRRLALSACGSRRPCPP
jgi:hypothetical protein